MLGASRRCTAPALPVSQFLLVDIDHFEPSQRRAPAHGPAEIPCFTTTRRRSRSAPTARRRLRSGRVEDGEKTFLVVLPDTHAAPAPDHGRSVPRPRRRTKSAASDHATRCRVTISTRSSSPMQQKSTSLVDRADHALLRRPGPRSTTTCDFSAADLRRRSTPASMIEAASTPRQPQPDRGNDHSE